jgi:hypothetical protein
MRFALLGSLLKALYYFDVYGERQYGGVGDNKTNFKNLPKTVFKVKNAIK